MTVLSVVGGKGPGPIEGEEPDRTTKPYVRFLFSFCIISKERRENKTDERIGSKVTNKRKPFEISVFKIRLYFRFLSMKALGRDQKWL